MEGLFRLARGLSRGSMLPASITNNGKATPQQIEANVFWVIQCGAEVGIPPTQALMNIASINGRPCMWGDLLIGLVRASGLAEYITETIEGEGADRIATCTTKRKDTGEIITRTFSWTDAIKAGLSGSNTYTKYGSRMLQMRARGWCLRDAYADVLKGMRMVEEERDHQGPDRALDITPADDPRPDPPEEETAKTEAAPDNDNLTANRLIGDLEEASTVEEIDAKIDLWSSDLNKLPQNYQDLVTGKYESAREALVTRDLASAN